MDGTGDQPDRPLTPEPADHRARTDELMDDWLTSVVVWWDDDGAHHVLAGPDAEPLPGGDGRPVHVLTAQDPYGERQPDDRNHDLLVGLYRWATSTTGAASTIGAASATDVDGGRVRWWPATGGSAADDHAEHGVVIAGLTRTRAAELGERFHQLAIYEMSASRQIVVPCRTPDDTTATARAWPPDRTWPGLEDRVGVWRAAHLRARGA